MAKTKEPKCGMALAIENAKFDIFKYVKDLNERAVNGCKQIIDVPDRVTETFFNLLPVKQVTKQNGSIVWRVECSNGTTYLAYPGMKLCELDDGYWLVYPTLETCKVEKLIDEPANYSLDEVSDEYAAAVIQHITIVGEYDDNSLEEYIKQAHIDGARYQNRIIINNVFSRKVENLEGYPIIPTFYLPNSYTKGEIVNIAVLKQNML